MSSKTLLRSRNEYKWFLPFQTRFLDNDRYGHMNNAVYHGIFDSVINIFLIRHVGLDIEIGKTPRVGFMVTNQCEFFAPAKYPDVYLVGMKLPKIGKSSLNYQLAMFPMLQSNISANFTHGYFADDLKEVSEKFDETASAVGHSVHVFVDPNDGNKPTPIPDEWRKVLKKLQ